MSSKKVVERKGTQLIHGDSAFHHNQEVAPSISVSTTFRSRLPNEEHLASDYRNPSHHVYSRYTQPVSTRAEHILSKICDGFAITYGSGLSAGYAALVFFKPRRIAISDGYIGSHSTLQVYLKSAIHVKVINIDDEFQPGDVCWLETPLNPTGESRDIQYYANKIHEVGGSLLIDSTFAPPPLQYPFNHGADCILYSATKYFGGHSDLLGGILVVKTKEHWDTLQHDRTYLGNVMGSLESWLLLRSLRTLHLRLARQSETATALAQWLAHMATTPAGAAFEGVPGGLVINVWHSSLQERDTRGWEPSAQMTGGWPATFSIQLSQPNYAAWFPHALKCFTAATSLGGVESLAEYRHSWDPTSDPRAVRVSIGVEDLEDLKADIRQALKHLLQTKTKL
ncbi:Cys/Met metabolism PLP-dependent enzyme-domain-containing protein [Mycena rebaudengoi]|nr:Cys/Met metabolism PLP-dependent enzyme-domain-containing protein [Mycena rebaudengoi]